MEHSETKQKEVEKTEEQPTTGVPGLDKMIETASYDSMAMAYGLLRVTGLELAEGRTELYERITQKIYSEMAPLKADPHHQGGVDFESDVSPVLRWTAFGDGFAAGRKDQVGAAVDETAVEDSPNDETGASEDAAIEDKNLNPCLATVRKWLSSLTYREKLLVALYSELLNKEDCFTDGVRNTDAYPDDKRVGNDLVHECQEAVVTMSQNPGYLENADRTEAIVTGFVMSLFPMSV